MDTSRLTQFSDVAKWYTTQVIKQARNDTRKKQLVQITAMYKKYQEPGYIMEASNMTYINRV